MEPGIDRTDLEAAAEGSELLSARRIASASDQRRRRVERAMHDGVQQHLALASLKVSLLREGLRRDPAAADALCGELLETLASAQRDMRELAHWVYPAVLENEGLIAALAEALHRQPRQGELHADGVSRHTREIETTVYFCCLEALDNIARHAPGAAAIVSLDERDGQLSFAVSDRGPGFDPALVADGGLRHAADRLQAMGGDLDVTSRPGEGTVVRGHVPLR